MLNASADSSCILTGFSLVRDLLIACYKCFVILIGIGVWCRWVSRWQMCCCEIHWLCRYIVVSAKQIFLRHAKICSDVDKLFDAGAPGLWKGAVPDGSRWSSFFCPLVSAPPSLRVSRELLHIAFLSHYSRQCDWCARPYAAVKFWMVLVWT